MIKTFPKKALLNPGGLTAFYFIPFEQVDDIPLEINGRMSNPLTLINDGRFFKGYATSDTLKYSEKTTKTSNGTYYTHSLQGNFPGDDGEVQSLFEEMEVLGRYYLVVFEDLLGRRRMAGFGGKLSFESSYDSENKRYSFSFNGDSLNKAPIYPFHLIF